MTNALSAAGCKRRTEREWRILVEEQRLGRESVRSFCETRGLLERTFEWWRWSLTSQSGRHGRREARISVTPSPARARRTVTALATPSFVELVRPARVDSCVRGNPGVEVVVECGSRVRRVQVSLGFDAATLRQVVSALEGEDQSC